MQYRHGITINRDLGVGEYNIKNVFSGIDELSILHDIFGGKKELEKILEREKVVIDNGRGYMYVDPDDGSIVIALNHLKYSDEHILYLDIIHELVHVKQFIDGRDIYDERYSYVDRETEIEAYNVAVKEGRRLGMNDSEILEYLRVEWVSEEELLRLAKRVGISIES